MQTWCGVIMSLSQNPFASTMEVMMQMRVHVMWCSLHVADTAVSQSRMYPREIFRVGALEGCCMRINFVYVIIGSLTCHKHI